ncbi:phage holin family protein [Actinotalea sp. K2]|uniref:phage holin family protein n=1 Tax=Actinotalea sp. K2 TaxID=2939438 RepID=UPI0020175F45|nr:phage holin family protein [Actinotalea sp. K2]MCL3862383.1 phage holin family protein [Actinotalea sp. K2]
MTSSTDPSVAAAAPRGDAAAPHPTHAPPAGTGTSTGHEASLGDLLSEITQDVSTLMRQEVALAKAEVAQSAKEAGRGAGMFAAAGVAGHLVLVFLSVALWAGLGNLVGHGWSGLVVAGLWAIVAAVLALRGRAEMRKVQGAPRTAETTKKIPNALKGHEERNT